MPYFIGFFVVTIVVLTLWNARMKRGYKGEEHVARNVDPLNDPETRRYDFPWV